ncbi:MAG: hypothetical protein CM1200mP12_08470 [Gammaproteobacteria bacterium]|nr:MAG: hypothetical protein CM1200mP12_08470 [Gammaproteobacteria bacterium]
MAVDDRVIKPAKGLRVGLFEDTFSLQNFMKRVVVTGLGIISSIGNNINKVTDSLKSLTSGIDINEKKRRWAFEVMFLELSKELI